MDDVLVNFGRFDDKVTKHEEPVPEFVIPGPFTKNVDTVLVNFGSLLKVCFMLHETKNYFNLSFRSQKVL